ncbi:mitochondrial cardiolipin hydrolase [Alosa pseudoharengus]|uniref:mitochondrial cardiolipin hydrolase n=1 Tax=Alosa pseudoharengus TaxID=34774 RepID=UPI003F8AE894
MPSASEVLKLVGVGVVGLTLGIEWLRWLYRRLKPAARVTEVLFFPCESSCVERLFASGDASKQPCPCGMSHSLKDDSFSRLLFHLLSARVSLDVCVFSFSNMELSRAVLHLHARGVCVRVIIDRDYMYITGSQIGMLRKAGVPVRHELSRAVHMHHKFAVVDGRLLVCGSLNWTMTAVQSNQENLLVTDDPAVVAPYSAQFQRLWLANDPARHKVLPAHDSHQKGRARNGGPMMFKRRDWKSEELSQEAKEGGL